MRRFRFRSYWVYSIGLAIAWTIVLALAFLISGWVDVEHLLLIFSGFCIGWVSTTIARYIYPPPQRWGTTT